MKIKDTVIARSEATKQSLRLLRPYLGRWLAMTIAFNFLFLSGCIRLVGKAGYYHETPEETKERVVGFDTAKMLEDKQTKGSITT